MFHVKKADYDSSNIVTKLDEFFSEQNEVTSVVREALQNVIDAKPNYSKDPARAKFSFKKIPWNNFKSFIDTDDGRSMNDHWSSPSLKDHSKDFTDHAISVLVVEDYNTTGLTGSFDKNEENSGSNLVNFWWNSGHGNKGKGTLGNAGVGKVTFTAASEMRTMWAMSNRLDDEIDRMVLIGYTDLPYHHVDGQSYLGYARYGVEEYLPHNDKKVLSPITDSKTIQLFEETFGIERKEPGTSIVIPAISTEFNQKNIIDAVMEHYFWAIINKTLVVEIVSDDGSLILLEHATVTTLMAQEPPNVLLNRRIEYALHAHLLMNSQSPKVFRGLQPRVDQNSKKYIFNKDELNADNLTQMRDYFDKGEMIMAQFILPFRDLKKDESKNGMLNIFYQKLGSKDEAPKEFMRLSISLTKLANSLGRNLPKNVFCFVMIEDPDMSDFVLSAEDVAHTTTTKRQFNKKKLFSPVEALSFVSNISDQLYAVLNRSDEENLVIESFDEHIFSIEIPDAAKKEKLQQKSNKEDEKEKDKKIEEEEIIIEERKVPVITQRELSDIGGFEVSSLETLKNSIDQGTMTLPVELHIKCAYLTLNGSNEAWRLYSKHDFEIGKDIKFSHETPGSVEVLQRELNELKLSINSSQFSLRLTGFDENRDLITKVSVESLGES